MNPPIYYSLIEFFGRAFVKNINVHECITSDLESNHQIISNPKNTQPDILESDVFSFPIHNFTYGGFPYRSNDKSGSLFLCFFFKWNTL